MATITTGRQLLKQGDTGVGICAVCERRVTTTYEYRDVPLEDPDCVADGVLVGVCERGHVVTIPWQSNHLLQEARRRAQASGAPRARVESRLTRRHNEALRVLAAALEVREDVFRPSLFRFYLDLTARDPKFASRLGRTCMAFSELPTGPADDRLSVPVMKDTLRQALEHASEAGITDVSALARTFIDQAWVDVTEGKPEARDRVAFLRGLRSVPVG